MDKAWFEMRDRIRRRIAEAVWVPLKVWEEIRHGKFGYLDYQEELYGVRSVAVRLERREEGDHLGWSDGRDVGIYVHEGVYKPVDVFQSRTGEDLGVELVLAQQFNGAEGGMWHLNQDLVFALKLWREGDVWLCPAEGYEEIVRLTRDQEGREASINIRAEYLGDYLAARSMALRVCTYRSRTAVLESGSEIGWTGEPAREEVHGGCFEGRAWDIHEGGHPYGAKTGVFHMSRTDVDVEAEVPRMDRPGDEDVASRHWTVEREGRRLCNVEGEFWRNEWVEPAAASPRVRGDQIASATTFVVDGAGRRLSADALNYDEVGQWLWFSPAIVPTVLARRGGALGWYTRETGSLRLTAGGGVHFGVNGRGLVNVYAHDVARLDEWERRIWAGFNLAPDGGVCGELTASQVHTEPASTQAPEAYLGRVLSGVNDAFMARFGVPLLREHDQHGDILDSCHRFRVSDQPSLLALAKDLARLTADSFDAGALGQVLKRGKGDKVNSLKGLQQVLEPLIGADQARKLVGPLVGIYDMRLGDAHLPSSSIADALGLARIDVDAPWVHQGRDLLCIAVSVLNAVEEVLRRTPVQA